MPRSPSTNRDIRDTRRADIVRAATKLFARRGFSDTKIGDIAKEAKLSHGLVYHYFPSKDAIFEAILADKHEAAWGDLERLEAEQGLGGALRAMLSRSIDEAHAQPEVTVMVTQALLTDSVPQGLRDAIRKSARQSFARTVSLLERGQQAGVVECSVPASQLAAAMFCLLRGVYMTQAQALRGHRWMPLPDTETVLRLVLPRSETQAAQGGSAGRGERATGTQGPKKKAMPPKTTTKKTRTLGAGKKAKAPMTKRGGA